MTAPATTPTVEDLPLEQLREWPRNPRRISKPRLEQLKRALEAEPEMLRARPLIALPDGTVVAGNQRLRAARDLGWPSPPMVVVDLDEARATEWALRDNRPYGEDDEPLVGELLAELAAAGRGLDLTGYESGEVDRLLAAVRPAAVVDPDEAPPLPAEPRSVRGEVYELGPHRLMCGDATSDADVAALVGDERIALAFTSPPYLDLRDYGGASDLAPEHLASFFGPWSSRADLIAVNLGMIVRDYEILEHWDTYIAAAREAGLKLLAWNVWNREDATSMAAQRMMFPLWHEFVFVFGAAPRDGKRVLPTKNAGDVAVLGQRRRDGSMAPKRTYPVADLKRRGSVLTTPSYKGTSDGGHPALFPVSLPTAYMQSVTDYDEVVADPFAGAGTTMIACEQLGRRALCMEIDPAYCDVIRQRYADFTGQPELAP